mgnify:CR=1 FL=1
MRKGEGEVVGPGSVRAVMMMEQGAVPRIALFPELGKGFSPQMDALLIGTLSRRK